MQPNSREAGYLLDMLQAARRLQEFTAGVSFEAYLESVFSTRHFPKCLEVRAEKGMPLTITTREVEVPV